MKGLKPDPWTGPCFSQLFKLGYRVTFMRWISNCIKCTKSNEYQVPRVIRFNSNVNGCLAKCFCFTCVWCSLLWGPNHEPCWQPAASAAEIKQEVSALWNKHTQGSTFLLPAAASNHLHVELFPIAVTSLKLWHVILHRVHQTSLITVPQNC